MKSNRKNLILLMNSLLMGSLTFTACDKTEDPTKTVIVPNYTLNFSGVVNGEKIDCGQTYTAIGKSSSSVEVKDVRFYIHDIELMTADGSSAMLEVKNDDEFQLRYKKSDGTVGSLVLIDFTGDNSDLCAERGTPALHTAVTGLAPEAEYTSVRFRLGVPDELNHVDAASAAAPLNAYGMQWTWTSGYRHMRIDVKATTGEKEKETYFFHPGAQGCKSTSGDVSGPYSCSYNINPQFELSLSPDSQAIEFDLARFYAQDDLNRGKGCMFINNIPDLQDAPSPVDAVAMANGCNEMFAAIGMVLPANTTDPTATPTVTTQTAFRVVEATVSNPSEVNRTSVADLSIVDPFGWPHPDYERNPSLDISAVSVAGEAKSHPPGDARYGANCMKCHQINGPGKGQYVIGGTVYDEDGKTWTDGGLIEIVTAERGYPRRPDIPLAEKLDNFEVKYRLPVDANGQFYATSVPELDYQKESYFVRILDTDEALKMVMPIAPSGACNHCHSTGFQIKIPRD